MTNTADATTSQPSTEEHSGHRLSAFLCWAVVFADIGTSVYYVPGILWRQVQWQSGLFVTLTLVAFTLLIFVYAEVSVRFPEGGGVVTAAANGLAPWAGVIGGMFILTSYFLTSAISSLSGLLYFSTVFKAISAYVLPITVIVVILLGLLNFWGIRESASVSAVIAVAALISDVLILVVVVLNVPMSVIGQVIQKVFSGQLGGVSILIGFSGAFLAFSGLESISQLSPVMALPRSKTVSRALILVALTVGVTSPLLTIFSTVLLNSPDLLATNHDPPANRSDARDLYLRPWRYLRRASVAGSNSYRRFDAAGLRLQYCHHRRISCLHGALAHGLPARIRHRSQ